MLTGAVFCNSVGTVKMRCIRKMAALSNRIRILQSRPTSLHLFVTVVYTLAKINDLFQYHKRQTLSWYQPNLLPFDRDRIGRSHFPL